MASWNNERIIPVFRDGQPEVARTNQASSNVSQGRQPNVQNVPFRNSLLVDPQEAMRKMQEQQMNFMSNWNPVDNDEFIQQFTNMMRFSPTVMTSPSPSLWLPSMSPLSTQQQPSGQGFQAPPMEPQGQYSANQGMTSSTPWRASGNVQVQPTSQPSQPSFQNSMKVEKPIQVKAQPPMRPAPPAPHSGMQPGFRPSPMEDKVQPAAVPAYQPSPPASWSPSIEKPFTPPMGNQGNSKTSSPLAYYNATATPFRSNLGSQTPSTPSTGSPKAFISPANLDMASEKGISPPITRPLYQPPLVSHKQPNHSPDIVPFKPVSPLVTYSNQPPPLVRQSSELRTQSPAPNATSGWNPEGDKEKFLDSVLSSMNFSPPVDSSNGSSRQAENFAPQVAPPAQDLYGAYEPKSQVAAQDWKANGMGSRDQMPSDSPSLSSGKSISGLQQQGLPPPPPPPPPGAPGAYRAPTYRQTQDANPQMSLQEQQYANLPSKLMTAMNKDKKPFSYTLGAVGEKGILDLSQIKSPRMRKRLMANLKGNEEAENTILTDQHNLMPDIVNSSQPDLETVSHEPTQSWC